MSEIYLRPMDSTFECSRRHAIKVIAAAAGGSLAGGTVSRTLAALPWAERPPALALDSNAAPLALGKRIRYDDRERQGHPTLAADPDGRRLWTAWTCLRDGVEGICHQSYSPGNESWGPVQAVDEPRMPGVRAASDPEIAVVGRYLVIVWLARGHSGWTLLSRTFDPATVGWGDVHVVAGSLDGDERLSYPAIASGGDGALVVWQARHAGRKANGIHGRWLGPDGRPAGDVFKVAADETRDCCRPAVAATSSGSSFAVAFDRQDGPGTQNVYLVLLKRQGRHVVGAIPVSWHPASDLSPALSFAPDGDLLWVAWHSNRSGQNGWDIPRWYRLAALRLGDHTWHQPVDGPQPPDPEPRGTVQGFELVRVVTSAGGAVCVLGRASHNFCLQYYTQAGRSPLYRLPEDGWGGRGRLLRGTFAADGRLWVTRRDLRMNVLHGIDGFTELTGPPLLRSRAQPAAGAARVLEGVQRRQEWPAPSRGADDAGLRLYFGDIHGHSWQSDGMGDPEESFLRARDVLRDDFHVLTDHDRFVGRRITDAQWQQQKDIARHYEAPGAFVTLFGQEWTTPRTNRPHGWGHFNIYSADEQIPLFDHGDPRYRDLPDLYPSLRTHQAIAIPHHIGWTGVPWDALDPELVPAVEICSVHGAFEYEGNEPLRHRGGMKGNFVRDGLAAGLRFGLVGGSDQHGLIWQHGVCWKRNVYRAGLTGVWAPDLSREALLDAIRARRTFATSGVKLCMRFSLNGSAMGSFVKTDEAPVIRVDVAVPPEEGSLAWLQIVRDGQVVHRFGGEGQRSRFTFVDKEFPPGQTSYYYLRVTLDNDNLAWSSPIWAARA